MNYNTEIFKFDYYNFQITNNKDEIKKKMSIKLWTVSSKDEQTVQMCRLVCNCCLHATNLCFLVSSRDSFTIFGLWVLGLTVSNINESNCKLMSLEH